MTDKTKTDVAVEPDCVATLRQMETLNVITNDERAALQTAIDLIERQGEAVAFGEVSAGYNGPSVVFPASENDDRVLSGMVSQHVAIYALPPTPAGEMK